MKQLLMALAMFLPISLFAAEGSHPIDLEDIQEDIAELSRQITSLQAALDLTTQVAIVMTVPIPSQCFQQKPVLRGDRVILSRVRCPVTTHLLGSTIADFPSGTVSAADGSFSNRTLPKGKYLVELRQPHSDNPLCLGRASASYNISIPTTFLRHSPCPQLVVGTGNPRLDAGERIYTVGDAGWDLSPVHRFANGFTFTDTAPASAYAGTIKITKLR